MNLPDDGWNVRELAEFAGTTVRTIHYYISEGLMPPPEGATRRASYSPAHLARLRLISALRDEGLALANIRQRLSPLTDEQAIGVASQLDRYMSQAETTPWTTLGLIEAAIANRNRGDDEIDADIRSGDVGEDTDAVPPLMSAMWHPSASEISGVNVELDDTSHMDSREMRESASEYLQRLRRSSPAKPGQPRSMPRPRPMSPKPAGSDDRPVAWYQFQIDDGIELRVREDRYRESKGRFRAVVDTLRMALRRYGLSGPGGDEP